MRHIMLFCFALVVSVPVARAQSVMDNLPPVIIEAPPQAPASPPVQPPPTAAPTASATPVTDPYTVTDVNADVTADNATHARDQALMQAERSAFTQLCARLNAPDSAAKMDDDSIAGLVQSFEVQSEHVSAVRYIGVFTIRFKPVSVQKKIGKYLASAADTNIITSDAKPQPQGPVLHLPVAVQTDSLADWTQIKRRLNTVPVIAKVDLVDLGRGVSHVDLSYTGAIPDLQQALTAQGLVLRQNANGGWDLYDGSMVTR